MTSFQCASTAICCRDIVSVSKLTATIALRRFGKNGMRKRALPLTKLAFR